MSAEGTLVIEVLSGGRGGERVVLPLPSGVGRSPESALCLPDAHLSAAHARFEARDGGVAYVDRASTNGSVHMREGRRTALTATVPEVMLAVGDTLELGDPTQAVILRVAALPEPADDTPGQVIARRAIADVEAVTQRVAADTTRLSALFRHARTLARASDLDAVLEAAAALVFELLPRATHLGVALREASGQFPVAFSRQRSGGPCVNAISRTLVRRVVDERAGLLLTNAATELSSTRSIVQAGLRSTLCVPLWTGDDVRGVLQVDNRESAGLFGAAELEALTVAAQHISLAAENARLVARLRHAEQRLEGENRFLKQREADATFSGIVGRSAGVEAVLRAVEKVRETRVPVLIQGETGTGKELVARALHYTSSRRERLFVAQNCSALAENLLESELFGHVKGAFTGADRDKKGLFELADGGTLFLDEVGEAPLSIQAKLLRVLQEGEIWPVGATKPRTVDVRVVSATHRDLERMVREGGFRQDLFYRLHVYPVRMPALRERREDIPLLARHFLDRYAREFGRAVTGFVPEAVERLAVYDWPGNVRELQNEVQRALITRTDGDLIQIDDLSPRLLGRSAVSDSGDLPRGPLKDMLDAVERLLLQRALREHLNNKTRAAEALGVTREGLHKKLARFGLHS